MAKLWAVIKREYLESVRNKWFVISTLFVPVVMAAAFLGPAYLATKSRASSDVTRVVVLDATGTGFGRRVAAALVADTTPGAPPVDVSDQLRVVAPAGLAQAESLATTDVMRKRFVGYLVLDTATLAGREARYAGSNATSIPDVERVRSVVRQQLTVQRLADIGLDANRVDSLTKFKLSMSAERITARGRGGSGIAAIVVGYGLAFLMYVSILVYGQNVMRGVMEEKTTRVAEVVVSSVRPETLLFGKIVGIGGVGLTQQIVWAITSTYLLTLLGPIVARMDAPKGGGAAAASAATAAAAAFVMPSISIPTLLVILAFFVLGVTFYCSMFAAVGSTVNSEQEARQAAMPVIFMIVPAILLAQPVLLNPTSRLAVTLSWLPFTAPIITPMRMMIVPLTPFEIGGSLLALGLSCAAMVWIAARIYRTGILMYGKRPSLVEMGRWVRRSA